VACFDAKYTNWAIRPVQLDPGFKPLFATPNRPSYPSAHSCLLSTADAILGYLFPCEVAVLNGMADETSEWRVTSGIHFRADIVAGQKLGRQVTEVAIDRAQSDGS
jgi:hypothetical protein